MSDSDERIKKKEESDDSSSDFDTMKLSKRKSLQRLKESDDEGSSSDSSVGDYLKKADEIDLNSSFFTTEIVPKVSDFATVKKSVQRLSESEDSGDSNKSDDEVKKQEIVSETKINFTQLRDYNKKIEETKACVEKYEKTKKEKKKEKRQDIKRLLSLGEKNESISMQSDFDDSDDNMDWQEIAESIDKPADKITIPKDGVQITVELPNVVKKKSKGIDMMAAIKRRINRIKKDHQVYVHKVHLLCWLAHGNYVNSVLNSENLLGLALYLLPSDKCYPPKHADMSYLEQITTWYGKVMRLQETADDFNIALPDALSNQISKKVARSKTNFIYIFIIILRSLGLQCRLVLSFQCLSLRPANSELCSLSTKSNKEGGVINDKNKTKKTSNKPSTSTSKEDSRKNNTVTNKNKDKVKSKTLQIPQVDGADSKGKNTVNNKDKVKTKTLRIPQLDGADDDEPSTSKPKRNKPAIKIKLKNNLEDSTSSSSDFLRPQTRLKSSEKHRKRHLSPDQSDHDFKPKRPSPEKSPKDINRVKTSADENKNRRTPENKELNLKSKLENNLDSSENSNNKNEQPVIKRTAQKRNLKDESSMDHKKGRSDVGITKNTTENKRLNLKSKLESNVTSTQETIININEESGFKRTTRNKNLKNMKSVALEITDESSMGRKKGRSDIGTTKNTPENKRLNLKSKLDNNVTSTQETIININEESGLKRTTRNKNNNKNEESVVKRTAQKRNLKEHISSVASKSADETSKGYKRTASNTKVENKPKASTTSPTKARRSNVMNDIVGLIKGQMSLKRDEEKSRVLRRSVKKVESDYDSDYFPDEDIELPSTSQRSVNKKYDSADEFICKVKRRVRPRSELEAKMLSGEDEEKKKKGNDVWVEVFLEEEEKWISVDLIKGQVHCVTELHSRATQPVNYIIAWNNNLSLKDITARYCTNWNTVIRKLRVDPNWWNEALRPFQGIKTIRDKEEDEDLAKQQLDKPLPTVIGEYKNHPLYVLERHLLKFEAIYPPNAMTLGFIRKEPVYARECVHTLHSREIWVKHAKVVKPKEQPYKIVKARPKYDRLTGKTISDLPLEVFGKWQVEDYDPPTAENGIVPRNAYGNVELFKPCMLPKKTVHLQLPGLNKVAKKLGIDCVPAVVGFDFHSGWNHPTFDGFVVCEEFKDTLIAAWQEDREETARKDQEKYDKRVWGNWRKLIKAVLICERLKARYDFGRKDESTEKESASAGKKKAKGPSFVAKKKKL